MKSDTTNLTWKPTMTMAKLFEEQSQFYDALAIYEIIGQSDESATVRQKIELLQFRILSDPNIRFDPRIEKLFSPEELVYLKILNHSAFENLSRIQTQFTEGTTAYDVELEEDEPAMRPTVSSYEVRRMVEEIDTLAVPKQPVKAEPEVIPEPIKTKAEPEQSQTESYITPTEEIEPLADETESTPSLEVARAEELQPFTEPIEPPAEFPEIEPDKPKSAAESLVSMLQREIAERVTTESEAPAQYIEPPAEDLDAFHQEFEPQVEQPEAMAEPKAEESTINDLAAELVNHFGQDSKLDAISVQEFMQVVLKHKLQNKSDKEE